jgi:hypothetical protein
MLGLSLAVFSPSVLSQFLWISIPRSRISQSIGTGCIKNADRVCETSYSARSAKWSLSVTIWCAASRFPKENTSRSPRRSSIAEGRGKHGIEFREFVPIEKIDPLYFESSYYLAPSKGAEKLFAAAGRDDFSRRPDPDSVGSDHMQMNNNQS